MELTRSRKMLFECVCGLQSESFHSLYQSETGEVGIFWKCVQCQRQSFCIVVDKRMLFTEEDKVFLKSCNAYLKEE